MTNDDAKYREREAKWIGLLGEGRWLKLPKKDRDFLVNTAGIINIGTAEETARAIKAVEDNEAGKYREWWEKLKEELKTSGEEAPFAVIPLQVVISRMLQIEQGEK